ncbi:hypothetical protein Ddc_05217 [Ditylenchus destructor]|nr:hypothetical protein Ddc_05217 [Ditylenchus destructor]
MPQPLTLIVNVFKFFDRKDLEIVSTSAKHANRIVRKHFPSKPYRFLKDVTLKIYRHSGKFTDGLAVELENHSTGYFALESMRPYLSQFVRFRETELFVKECSYTPEDMTILASISHVWSGRSLWLRIRGNEVCGNLKSVMNFPNNISHSLHNILTNDAIFSSRCLELYDASRFVSLHDYSRIYTVDVLFLKSFQNDHLNIGTFLALIEHKPQFPESKSVFVLDISFSSASTPCPFQLVIIDDESNGENEEFRMENETTHEVLQLKNIEKDSLFVTKLCEHCNFEFDAEINEQIILIERSRL